MEKKRILLVDDEASFTRLLRLHLEQTGKYEVREENEGLETLAVAKEFHPDLILMDIIMPDVSGADIAAQIKLERELKDVPIVFITAIMSKEEVNLLGHGGGSIGGNRFVAKPVRIEEVMACIEQSIGEEKGVR